MLEVTKKANELANALEKKIAELDSIIKINTQKAEELDRAGAALQAEKVQLMRREDKVRPIESALALRNEAEALKLETYELLEAVRKEKAEFNKDMAQENGKMAVARQKFSEDSAKNASENALIKNEWAALRKEQAEWKAKFYEDVKNRIA